MPTFLQKPVCVAALMVLAVVVLLHGNLNARFYGIDDQRYVPHSVKGKIGDLFTPTQGILYGPVTFLSLRLDRNLFGPSVDEVLQSDEMNAKRIPRNPTPSWAWGPRLMNGIYHGLAGLVLWYFFARLGVGSNTALFIAFVWTAHPIALESVAWVCERKNVLCALFGFLTLAVWTCDREWRLRWPLVTLFYILALLSKLSALSFLPVLVALELFDPRRSEPLSTLRFWLRLTMHLSVILIVSAVIVKITIRLFANDIAAPPGGSAWTGLLTDADIFGRYMLNILVPVFSSFFYGVEPIESLADARFWMYMLAIAAFWASLYKLARVEDRRWIAVGFLWFFGALGPNANILASAFPMQDRYSYLPMPGLLLAFAMGMRGLFARFPSGDRYMPVAGAVYATVVLLLCGIRSPLFRSSDLLTYDSVQRQPLSGYAMMMASFISDRNYRTHLPNGPIPNPDLAQRAAEQAVEFYAAAERTPDYWQFSTPLNVRTERAELLLFLMRDREAADSLGPVLKSEEEMKLPIDPRKIFPGLPDAFRLRFKPKATRQMMARAWLVSAEALLRVSFRLDTPKAERLGVARRSLEHARHGLEFEEADPVKGTLSTGLAQLRISYLLAEENKMDEAKRVYAEARETLSKDIVKNQGKVLLKEVPEPEPPKTAPVTP